jgi:hypothetical protein
MRVDPSRPSLARWRVLSAGPCIMFAQPCERTGYRSSGGAKAKRDRATDAG